MVLGPMPTGPTTEEQIRTKEAQMTDEREHVALEASAADAAADAAAETPTRAVAGTSGEARPGFMEGLRRLFRRG